MVGNQQASRVKNVPTKSQAVTPRLKKSISLSAGANAATQQMLSETEVFTCLDLFAHQLLSPHIPPSSKAISCGAFSTDIDNFHWISSTADPPHTLARLPDYCLGVWFGWAT